MVDASSELLAELCSCVCHGQGGWQAPKGKLLSWVWANAVALTGFVGVQLLCSVEGLGQESCVCEVLSWNLLRPTYLSLFLYHVKSKQFSAFHAPGAASSCVEIIHDTPTSLCRNWDLLPALLTLHMSYLSRYLFWIGCFAICSFSTMTEIYSDFRGLIWRNSTVGGQTLCCSVPNKFLFFPAEHTLNSACFGIGGQKKKRSMCFSQLYCYKARKFQRRWAVLPLASVLDSCWQVIFVVWLCLCSDGERKKWMFRGKNRQELSKEKLRVSATCPGAEPGEIPGRYWILESEAQFPWLLYRQGGNGLTSSLFSHWWQGDVQWQLCCA